MREIKINNCDSCPFNDTYLVSRSIGCYNVVCKILSKVIGENIPSRKTKVIVPPKECPILKKGGIVIKFI